MQPLRVSGGDVELTASVTDVRCDFFGNCDHGTTNHANAAAGPDYLGELRLSAIVRATDKLTSPAPTPSGQGSGTVQDVGFGPSIPCTQTVETTIGSTCSISTTVNTLIRTAGERRAVGLAAWSGERLRRR